MPPHNFLLIFNRLGCIITSLVKSIFKNEHAFHNKLFLACFQHPLKLKACQIKTSSGLSSCYHLWQRSTGWSLRVPSAPFSTLWPWHEPSKDYNDLWPCSAERPHAGGWSSASSPWLCTWHRSYPEEERAYLASRSHEPEIERDFLISGGVIVSLKVQPRSN